MGGRVGRAPSAPWCPQGSRRLGWPGIPRDCKSPSSFYKQELLSVALNTHGRLFLMFAAFSAPGALPPAAMHSFPSPHSHRSHSSSPAASKDSHNTTTSIGSKVKSQGALSLHTSFTLGSMIYQSSKPTANEACLTGQRARRSWDRFSSLYTSLLHISIPFCPKCLQTP